MISPDRQEALHLEAVLDRGEAELRRARLEHLGFTVPAAVADGDSVAFVYQLNIDYYGHCVEVLEEFVALGEAGALRHLSCHEVRHGYCLAERFFTVMSRFRDLAGKRGGS